MLHGDVDMQLMHGLAHPLFFSILHEIHVKSLRCSHVVKHKPPSYYIQAIRKNVEGHGHGLLDFHASTKESLTYNRRSQKAWRPIVEGEKGFNPEEEVSR